MLHCPVVSVLYSTLFTDMESVCYIEMLLVCYILPCLQTWSQCVTLSCC